VGPWKLELGLLVAVTSGCATASYSPPPVAAAPCTVAGFGTPDHPWREVHASGFSFCVPGSWSPSGRPPRGFDASVWTGPEGAVSWATSPPPPVVVTRDCVTTRDARSGESMGTSCTAAANLPPPCSQPTTGSEDVGGLTITVEQFDCREGHIISATSHGIYLRAAASQTEAVELELAMLRTIRLLEPTR